MVMDTAETTCRQDSRFTGTDGRAGLQLNDGDGFGAGAYASGWLEISGWLGILKRKTAPICPRSRIWA